MKIALAQISATPTTETNLQLIRKEVQTLVAEDARLLVFPEASMCSFGPHLLEETARSWQLWEEGIKNLAQEYGIYLVAGGFAPSSTLNPDSQDNRILNRLIVANPEGEAVFYNKIHLYDAFGYRESDTVAPGQDPLLFDIDGTTIGLATCYDIRFPKLYATYARAGAQVILTCASWAGGPGKENQWKILTAARALDSNCFHLAVDQADPRTLHPEADWTQPTGIGHTRAVSPFGEVLAELGEKPGALVLELHLEETERAAATLPILTNARLGY